MITKAAMAKIAASDERDQAEAIDLGFELACRDMKLGEAHTAALAKVAMARIAEFKKTAAAINPNPPPAEQKANATELGRTIRANVGRPVQKAFQGAIGQFGNAANKLEHTFDDLSARANVAHGAVHEARKKYPDPMADLAWLGNQALTGGPLGSAAKRGVGDTVRAVKPWVNKNVVTPMQRGAENAADIAGYGIGAVGNVMRQPALRPLFGNAGKALKRYGEKVRGAWPLGRS